MSRALRYLRSDPPVSDALVRQVHESARPLVTPADLDPLLKRIGRRQLVLIGEASHGTSEYYTWRAALSRRLIEEEGFRFIAVEGDWPACLAVNRFVKGETPDVTASAALGAFRRWPTWMWANEEVLSFITWLKNYNAVLPMERRVGFYGLDVYSLWESMAELDAYLKRHDPAALSAMAQVLRCFDPFDGDAQMYALATARYRITCAPVVARLVQRLAERAAEAADGDPEARLDAQQNAAVISGAEAYYRAMADRDVSSWNIRDRHMDATLARLMAHHGPAARGLVWEHNTHVGDARYTDMALDGDVNVGQLARERYGDDAVVLVGFASFAGRVVAGAAWDAPMAAVAVPPGRPDSWEDVLHKAGGDQLLIFGDEPGARLPEELLEERGHRAIGVVYHPEREQYGNYVPTILPRRYDALLYLDRTTALHPLGLTAQRRGDTDDTFPSAF